MPVDADLCFYRFRSRSILEAVFSDEVVYRQHLASRLSSLNSLRVSSVLSIILYA